jgi:GTP cyclohydrolase I
MKEISRISNTLSEQLDRTYDCNLEINDCYKNNMSNIQEGPSSNIKGSHIPIQQVGMHNFKLPITYKRKNDNEITLETSITGTVSLEAELKGINMSRIIRAFYEYKDHIFSIDVLHNVLQDYKLKLGSYEANIILNFSYPILQQSLRSNLFGWQFYNTSIEARYLKDNTFKKIIHFDFVYSSACPCSFELALQAMSERNKAVVPHSQRSKARISIEFNDIIWIEDIHEICLDALKTETQVIVKREDEQAFAELNGANLKFVEDSVRLIHAKLENNKNIIDFKIVCSHFESLHSHNAVSVLVKDIPGGFDYYIPLEVYESLIC